MGGERERAQLAAFEAPSRSGSRTRWSQNCGKKRMSPEWMAARLGAMGTARHFDIDPARHHLVGLESYRIPAS